MCVTLVFTEKYCTANGIEKLPGPRDWVQILQDQIKLARRRLKRGEKYTQERSFLHRGYKVVTKFLFMFDTLPD